LLLHGKPKEILLQVVQIFGDPKMTPIGGIIGLLDEEKVEFHRKNT
jgi:hypothetical protein